MELWLVELGGESGRVGLVQILHIDFSYQIFVDFLEKVFYLLILLGSFIEAFKYLDFFFKYLF